jgi:uncharacterized protein involved in response to NO
MTPIPRLRAYRGPAILSYGFRPFFLFGALYAGLEVLVWLPLLHGEISVPTVFPPRDWHVHEMLYGYLPAVMTGFLLTAIPNWTGRLPIQAAPLLVLVATWAAGRLAIAISALIGWLPAAVVDSAFLVMLAAAIAREIIVGRNWRNLKIVAIVAVLAAGNVAFHLEVHVAGSAEYSMRLGIAAVVTLLMLIAGRIIPSFTRNWLARENPGRLPAPFGRFDMVAIIVGVAALALWVCIPAMGVIGAALAVAGVLQAARLARWAGERTARERLLLVLHVGYAFVPLGFLLVALASFDVVYASAGIHAWMVGGVGTMTLAVMTRASLGHTGHELTASLATQFIYAAVLLAALARICAALEPRWNEPLLQAAAFAWAAAFLGFGVVYGPMLCRERKTMAVEHAQT